MTTPPETNDVSLSKPPAKKGWRKNWEELDNWWSLLLLLFCVTGICGLPLIFASKAYKKPGKVVLSVVVTVYTFILCWAVFQIMMWSWRSIQQALG